MRSRRRSLVPAVLLVLGIVAPSQLHLAGAATDPYSPIDTTSFKEGSGATASRAHPDVMWAHEDSGNPDVRNRLWAFQVKDRRVVPFASGASYKPFEVPGTRNVDWEDVAADDRGNLWVADIGNNSCTRSNLMLHKVAEPDPNRATSAQLRASYPIKWPAGSYPASCTGLDAESLFVVDGTPYIVSKTARPAVFKLATFNTGSVNTLVKVGDVTPPSTAAEIARPTGASLSTDRRYLALAIEGRRAAVYKTASPSLDGDALVRDLISRPPAAKKPYHSDGSYEQVEAVTFSSTTNDLVLISEQQPVYYWPATFWATSTTSGTTSTASSLPSVSRPRGRLAPATGALLGSWYRPSSWDLATVKAEITRRENGLGRRQDIAHHFYGWSDANSWPSATEQWHADSGRIPMVSWGGTNTGNIAAGSHDSRIRAQADKVAKFGTPMFIRWFWEPDASENRDRVISPSSYIAAWRRIHNIFQARGASNAVFVWCPTAYGFVSGEAQKYYPGDAYVDWVCADGYNWAPGRSGAEWRSFAYIYRGFYDWAMRNDKPLMVGEYGVQERSAGEKAQWFRDTRSTLKNTMKGIAAVVYFDANRLYDWRLETSTSSYDAYKAMARDDWFNVGPGGMRVATSSGPSVTLGRVPATKYGQDMRLRGVLYRDRSRGTTLEGHTVRLQMREARRDGRWTSWSRVASKTTRDGGRYRFVRTARRNVRFRVVFPGTSRLSSATSRVRSVAVSRRIGARLDDRRVRRGTRVALAGAVTPNAAGKAILLQRRPAGRSWDTIDRKRVRSNGTYRFRTTARPRGRVRYRAVMRSSAMYAGSRSPARTLKVR